VEAALEQVACAALLRAGSRCATAAHPASKRPRSSLKRSPNVFQAICQRERQLQSRSSTCLLHSTSKGAGTATRDDHPAGTTAALMMLMWWAQSHGKCRQRGEARQGEKRPAGGQANRSAFRTSSTSHAVHAHHMQYTPITCSTRHHMQYTPITCSTRPSLACMWYPDMLMGWNLGRLREQ
jgi:hypothetical protein